MTEVKAPATLLPALLAFQAEAPKLQKDKINPAFKSKYLSLSALMEQVLPALNSHGLVWATLPTSGEHGEPALTYRLIHASSGEVIEGTMPLLVAKQDPQGMGSALTYARRQALMAVLGLVADEDDDGNRAVQRPREVARPAANGNGNGSRLLTPVERVKVIDAIDEAGDQLALVLASVGLESADQMTVAHSHQIKTLIEGAT